MEQVCVCIQGVFDGEFFKKKSFQTDNHLNEKPSTPLILIRIVPGLGV